MPENEVILTRAMTIMPQPKTPLMRDANPSRINYWRQVTVHGLDHGSGWGQNPP